MIVLSAGHVAGTRGAGIVSSTADVLWMSVVRGMKDVGGVCEMCMCMHIGCVWYVCCYVKKKAVSLQLVRGGIWVCMRCHCLCICWVLI